MAKDKERKLTPDEIVGQQPSTPVTVLSTIGLLGLVAGALIPIFFASNQSYTSLPPYYKYIFGAGALMLLVARIMNRYTGQILRVKRLYRIETWSALFFCVATFFLFYSSDSSRDWLAFTLAGGVLQVFTSIMIPRTLSKAIKENS
ncbi:MAG: hypothetical protein K2G64_04030 [Muribaculaceae bacterium]|nr:hypothetical protein [Muribaculaceae bacterium]MDE5968256.1 hypothetical protein [Muribaculaceae bacterium]MDE7393181.1 hypothetical protein [Muribaculaceae bacterium]